ncbi:MAG: metallophosphoesterase [Lentisphaeria bacterium]|jgi:hypothetical protein|nr:metallophosphoesterase [Lentisphaeria bacterium]MDP7741380.1 metallophosphoesterase [Lentisphaeria bacterium]
MFSFAFITDPQIGLNSPNGLHAADSDRGRMDRAVDFINGAGIDLVFFGGDHIDVIDSEEQRDLFLAGAARLNVPWYGVPGNHDQHPVSLEHEATPKGFLLNHKGSFFIGVNACALRGDLGPEPQAAEWGNLRAAIGAVPAEATHRFVIMHWPLFILHPDEEDSVYNMGMSTRHELAQFFRESGITCVFSGHRHQDIDIVWQGVRLIMSIGTSAWHHYPEEASFKLVTVFDGGFSVRRVSAEAPPADQHE